MRDLIAKLADSVTTTVKTNSVINCLLVLTGVISPLCFCLALVAQGWKAVAFFGFAAAPVLAVLTAFAYFAKTAPDYLRSEEFQFNRIALSLLGEKGKTLPPGSPAVLTAAPPDEKDAPRLLLEPPKDDGDGAQPS